MWKYSVSDDMDVLLINSPRGIVPFKNNNQDRRMPLGIMYIASYLKSRGVTTGILDAEALALGVSDIASYARQVTPKIIGLNCHTLNRQTVYEIVRTLRVLLEDVLIILGGPHPTLAPQDTLEECSQIDAVVIGEGERTVFEISQKRYEIEEILGIAYIRNGEFRINAPMPRIENLDDLPFPNPADVPFKAYTEYEDSALPALWHRAYLSASRGCRFKCSFCAENPLWQGSITFRSCKSMMREIQQYCNSYGIYRFYFYDDTLTDWPELLDFCEASAEISIHWSCSTRIDHINDQLIRSMSRGGCKEIAFGLESGSEKLLKQTGKGWQAKLSKEQVGDIIRKCVEHGITPRTHFMIGFPWEEQSDITETIKFAVMLKQYLLSDANFFTVKVYPGTPFFTDVYELGDNGLVPVDKRIYDSWSVFDWFKTRNKKVAAKLRRSNDIPEISIHPHLDSLALRQLVRNAYEIFFGECTLQKVEQHLWLGVKWQD